MPQHDVPTIGEQVGMKPPTRRWGKSAQLVSDETFVGLEIELEKINLNASAKSAIHKNGLWAIVDDGSLRNNGKEFIMCEEATGQPLLGGDIIRALDDFQTCMDILTAAKRKPATSSRTSTHVHLDVRSFTRTQLKRLFLLYYTFEEALFKWVGEDRHKSNYCRPLASFNDISSRAAGVLMDGLHAQDLASDGNKYDAFNFHAIRTHGTVEIRIAQAYTSKEELLKWINILLRIHQAALDDTIDVEAFPEMVSDRGMVPFIEQVFKAQATELIPLVDDIDVLNGVRCAQEIMVIAELEKVALSEKSLDKAYKTVNPENNPAIAAFTEKLSQILEGDD